MIRTGFAGQGVCAKTNEHNSAVNIGSESLKARNKSFG